MGHVAGTGLRDKAVYASASVHHPVSVHIVVFSLYVYIMGHGFKP